MFEIKYTYDYFAYRSTPSDENKVGIRFMFPNYLKKFTFYDDQDDGVSRIRFVNCEWEDYCKKHGHKIGFIKKIFPLGKQAFETKMRNANMDVDAFMSESYRTPNYFSFYSKI